MSQYGAYGYAKHGKGYRFILGHYYSGTRIARLNEPRIVRVLLEISPERRRLQRRQQRLREGPRPEPQLRGAPGRGEREAAQLHRPAAGRLRAAAARRRGRDDRDRGRRHLPRGARGRAHRQRRRLAQHDQRPAGRPVREGRGRQRVAALLARGRPARAGRCCALLRSHRRRRRQRLRPLQRHPQPGLRRTPKRDRLDQRRHRRDQGAGGDLRRTRSPRPTSRPVPAATPRASRTSSSARPSPTWSASPTPTTTTAHCTPGR